MLRFNEYINKRTDEDASFEIQIFEDEIQRIIRESKPSEGTSKKEKSALVKKAKEGKDLFGDGKNFDKIAKKAGKRYGSKDSGKRVAAAIMWKKAAKKKMTAEEYVANFLDIIEEDFETILNVINEAKKAKKQDADDEDAEDEDAEDEESEDLDIDVSDEAPEEEDEEDVPMFSKKSKKSKK